jgi:transcription-repair coupling factor (superfamily II helicase)
LPELSPLLRLIDSLPAYSQLVGELEQRENISIVVLEAARPYLIAAVYERLRRPLLLVTAQPENARKLQEQLAAWYPGPVKLFPEPDILPYERLTPDTLTEMERVRVLAALTGGDINGNGDTPPVVVPRYAAILPPPATLSSSA